MGPWTWRRRDTQRPQERRRLAGLRPRTEGAQPTQGRHRSADCCARVRDGEQPGEVELGSSDLEGELKYRLARAARLGFLPSVEALVDIEVGGTPLATRIDEATLEAITEMR